MPQRWALGQRSELYSVTSLPETDSAGTSWSATGDMDTLRQAFASFPQAVRTVLTARPSSPQAKPCIFLYGVANGRWSAPNGAKLTC